MKISVLRFCCLFFLSMSLFTQSSADNDDRRLNNGIVIDTKYPSLVESLISQKSSSRFEYIVYNPLDGEVYWHAKIQEMDKNIIVYLYHFNTEANEPAQVKVFSYDEFNDFHFKYNEIIKLKAEKEYAIGKTSGMAMVYTFAIYGLENGNEVVIPTTNLANLDSSDYRFQLLELFDSLFPEKKRIFHL